MIDQFGKKGDQIWGITTHFSGCWTRSGPSVSVVSSWDKEYSQYFFWTNLPSSMHISCRSKPQSFLKEQTKNGLHLQIPHRKNQLRSALISRKFQRIKKKIQETSPLAQQTLSIWLSFPERTRETYLKGSNMDDIVHNGEGSTTSRVVRCCCKLATLFSCHS